MEFLKPCQFLAYEVCVLSLWEASRISRRKRNKMPVVWSSMPQDRQSKDFGVAWIPWQLLGLDPLLTGSTDSWRESREGWGCLDHHGNPRMQLELSCLTLARTLHINGNSRKVERKIWSYVYRNTFPVLIMESCFLEQKNPAVFLLESWVTLAWQRDTGDNLGIYDSHSTQYLYKEAVWGGGEWTVVSQL